MESLMSTSPPRLSSIRQRAPRALRLPEPCERKKTKVANATFPTSSQERETTQAVKALPTSIKEKRIPRAEAPYNPFTKRNKRKKSMGIRR
eukprot:109463-Pelagomonas_calceolata.AAC.1